MTHNPNPYAGHDRDNDPGTRDDPRAPEPGYPYRDPRAAVPGWKDAFSRRYRLTPAGERYLHFNGAQGPGRGTDHDSCRDGTCPYRAEAENSAALQGWMLPLNRESGRVDPEAGQ